MNPLACKMLELAQWESLHADGSNASFVPGALKSLIEAADDQSAEAAYWRLDNRIVVQGRVFDSARALAPVLLALLAGELSPSVRVRILDLLFEMQGGQVHEEELARGGAAVGTDCTRIIQEGLWTYYACLLSKDARVRRSAVDLIGQLDQDSNRRSHILEWVCHSDTAHEVQEAAGWWLDRWRP